MLETNLKTRAATIYSTLVDEYPDSHCALNHSNPFELLCATILSAQCTDVRVNTVTPALFAKYPDPFKLSQAPQKDVEALVRSTGFFKNKARSLIEMSKALVDRHKGEVPRTMEELTALAGVGRKTANVLLGNAFGIPGMVVDTHVSRLSQRLGLTGNQIPEKIEEDLQELFPPHQWTMLAHLFISHGRNVCFARKPKCHFCIIAGECPSAGIGSW